MVTIFQRMAALDLTRSILENPAFNYGFFRPNPASFAGIHRKNAGHGRNFTRSREPEASLKVAALELKETVSVFQQLLIHREASLPLSNPLPSGSGRGRLDDRKR